MEFAPIILYVYAYVLKQTIVCNNVDSDLT